MANGIKFGSSDISKLMLGTAEVTKVYLGTTVIYESVKPALDEPVLYIQSRRQDTCTFYISNYNSVTVTYHVQAYVEDSAESTFDYEDSDVLEPGDTFSFDIESDGEVMTAYMYVTFSADGYSDSEGDASWDK